MKRLTVSLGVINKSENVTWEMAKIMEELQKCVPCFKTTSGSVVCQTFRKTLFVGDQLTCERARGAQKSVRSEVLPEDQLRGLVPATADWHAKMCFLQVCRMIVNCISIMHVPCIFVYLLICMHVYRSFGITFIAQLLLETREHYSSFETYFDGQPFHGMCPRMSME